jgi:hypothetical protein
LTDPTQASARIEGATVTIRTKGGFMANVISGAAIMSVIKEAASAVLNRPAVYGSSRTTAAPAAAATGSIN